MVYAAGGGGAARVAGDPDWFNAGGVVVGDAGGA